MVTKDLKISKLLSQYPQVVDVLIEASPHFKKLKNPILLKALASRVNIGQAAKIADVDVNVLLEKINNSINKVSGENITENEKSKNVIPEDNKMQEDRFEIDESKVVTFDVRPIISGGKDPLKFILAKVKELKNDEILLLINSFEPIPLYSVLSNKGYSHKVVKEDETFKIYFIKDNKLNKTGEEANSKNEINVAGFENIVELDVRGLGPPEPMVKVLEELSKIDNNTAMLVHHHREPLMLYPKLEERGYQAFCTKINENYFKIVIAKKK